MVEGNIRRFMANLKDRVEKHTSIELFFSYTSETNKAGSRGFSAAELQNLQICAARQSLP